MKKEMVFPREIEEFIEACKKASHPEGNLIAILHKIQGHYGYLSQEAMEAVSEKMQIPTAKISGVASFYHFFRLKPSGQHRIEVCLGTACHVKGAELVAKKLQEELGIEMGETTKDGVFSLEPMRCLGMCALAPVIKIGEEIFPKVSPDQIPAILEKILHKGK